MFAAISGTGKDWTGKDRKSDGSRIGRRATRIGRRATRATRATRIGRRATRVTRPSVGPAQARAN